MNREGTDPDTRFAALQAQLRRARWPLGDGRLRRLLVVIPSINLDATVMTRHGDALAVYEERGLWWILALRQPWVHAVAVLRQPPAPEVVSYYLSLMPDGEDARGRLTLISLDDDSARPLADVLLDRPEVLERLRGLVGGDPTAALVMPFNVTHAERDVALAIGAPIYGVDHRFAHFGRKSAGRRLFAEVGVSCAPGVEDVRSAADVDRAIVDLRPRGDVVVKLDDSVFGEGNRRLVSGAGARDLPRDYLADLERLGGVVESWITGDEVESPSVQLRILPGGEPLVISSHDQLLGGDNGQMFVGCRFPAREPYHAKIVADARAIGSRLAAEGVVGRFGIDFVAVRGPDQTWHTYAMELNLREGGTSHPYGSLWFLTEGNFDADAGAFRLPDGGARAYVASDSVPVSMPDVETFLQATRKAAVGWDAATGTGSVFHMFRAIPAEGRIAAVTVGTSHEDAVQRHERLIATVA